MARYIQTIRLKLTAAQVAECLPGVIFEVPCHLILDGEDVELMDFDDPEYADWDGENPIKWRTLEQYAAPEADPACWEYDDED